jgi:hypothetical protein
MVFDYSREDTRGNKWFFNKTRLIIPLFKNEKIAVDE